VADARAANKTVSQAHNLDNRIWIWSIPEDLLRRVCIEDSAFNARNVDKNQNGWIIGYSTPELAIGKSAKLSFISWKSKKLRRKASSSLLCEALSCSFSVGQWLFLSNLEMSMRYSDHRHGSPLHFAPLAEPTVLTKQSRRNQDPTSQLIMDAKSLYDALNSEQTNQDDARAALEAAIIREDLEKLDGIPRWVPHDKNPSDALTKVEGAHVQPLVQLLKTSMFQITPEKEELEVRSKQKEEKGYVPRPRIGYIVDVCDSDAKENEGYGGEGSLLRLD